MKASYKSISAIFAVLFLSFGLTRAAAQTAPEASASDIKITTPPALTPYGGDIPADE